MFAVLLAVEGSVWMELGSVNKLCKKYCCGKLEVPNYYWFIDYLSIKYNPAVYHNEF